MHIRTITVSSLVIARVEADDVVINDVDSALNLMASVRCETSCDALIIDAAALNPDFFELRTQLAGEILQKFVTYAMHLAIVGDFSGYMSRSLQDFIRESNRGWYHHVCS
jgi:hypothetical protein